MKGKSQGVQKSEEEQVEEEMRTMFPSYEAEFSLEASEDEKTDRDEEDYVEEALLWKLQEGDLWEISQLHKSFVHSIEPIALPVLKDHLIEIHALRYTAAHGLFLPLANSIPASLDSRLWTHLIACQHLHAQIQGNTSESEDGKLNQSQKNKPFDLYHNPDTWRARKCLDVLRGLRNRIHELLDDWPDHPTLQQILMVVERILSFSIVSPLMRFLVGLEMVLGKCQEWEMNAHRKVSLFLHLETITALVIEWRKLELHSWSRLLDTVTFEMEEEAGKWWFHLYGSLKQDHSVESLFELDETLRKFIEDSPIGQVEARLGFLHAFATELTQSDGSVGRHLWNLYDFYAQFLPLVREKILIMRRPIEKELKDFVKISRWNDLNYWAVKEAVDKSHRTLHKHTKAFKAVLNIPMREGVLKGNEKLQEDKPAPSGLWDKKQEHLVSPEPILPLSSHVLEEKDSLLRHIPRARTLIKEILAKHSIDHAQEIDDFTSQKGLLGSVKAKAKAWTSLPALSGTLTLLPNTKQGQWLDEKLRDCQGYYFKSIYRYDNLEILALSPAKELGLPVIHRIQGITPQFLERIQHELSKCLEALVEFNLVLESHPGEVDDVFAISPAVPFRESMVPRNFPMNVDVVQTLKTRCESAIGKLMGILQQDASDQKLHLSQDDILKQKESLNEAVKEISGLKAASVVLSEALASPIQHLHSAISCVKCEHGNWIDDIAAAAISIDKAKLEADIEAITESILLGIQAMYKQMTEIESKETEGFNLPDVNVQDEMWQRLHGNNKLGEWLQDLHSHDHLIHLPSSLQGKLKEMETLVSLYEALELSVLCTEIAGLRSSTKLLSVILGIFCQLLSKGFCLPSESMEEGGASDELPTKFEDIRDGGLGEGEGIEDISERIESEDQLEGAQRPGDKEPQADKDLKEEEKGVEMSGDFEGKLQDVSEKEDNQEGDDEEDNDQEEQELDKQMGETDNGADTLDEKIWGDKEEEKDEREGELKEDGGKGGEEEGEEELAPKGEDKEKLEDLEKEEKERKGEGKKPDKDGDVDDDQMNPLHVISESRQG
ncbi:unnamed protein product [Darwinula stevensoni]|uniref:Midasin n=1 Tax=Darwinula stevensoni TaxID=69355 RepID=A0A7R9A493_9CRUS|nr:unnamed protein product [Darwinula stevensoni]CAG0889503.1 unnamed protein product [Darwinula stevensoni]